MALSNDDNDARIENGRLVANRVVGEALHTQTGPDGRFRFQPQAKPVWVVAAHDAGFAARSPEELAASTDVTLAPWGRIEGVMKTGTKPAPGRRRPPGCSTRRSVAGSITTPGRMNRVGSSSSGSRPAG